MPLPTSSPNAPINGLRPIQADPPAANASAINALFAAYRDGYLTANDIADGLTQKPLRNRVENAANQDRLDQIKIAPRRREQELTQEDQRTQLNDLILQQHANDLKGDSPQRKLQDLQIKRLEQETELEPEKRKADLAYRDAQIAALNAKAHPPGESIYSQQLSKGTIEDIDKTIAKVDTFSPGAMAATGRAISSKIPGTEMKDFAANLESLKAKIGFSQLQEMRDASRTGGALGSLAVKESEWLQNSISALDPAMSPSALKANLQTIRERLVRWEEAKKAAAPAGAVSAGGTTASGALPLTNLGAATGTPSPDAPEVTLEEYNALPEGAPYRAPGDPPGKVRYKTGPGGRAAQQQQAAPMTTLPAFQPVQPATRNVVNRIP